MNCGANTILSINYSEKFYSEYTAWRGKYNSVNNNFAVFSMVVSLHIEAKVLLKTGTLKVSELYGEAQSMIILWF